jgi:hypothetical protein
MPSGFTDATAEAMLEHFLKGTAYVQPAALYLGLANADPGRTATLAAIAEPLTSNGYGRVNLSGKLGAASGGIKTNSGGAIVFAGPATPGAWGSPPFYFITDAASGTVGNVIWTGAFGAAKPVNVGGSLTIASSTLQLVLARHGDSGFTTPYLNKVLDSAFRGTLYTQPVGSLSAGLSTASPGATGVLASANEEAGTGYGRQVISTHLDAAGATTAAQKLLNADISFGPASAADWTDITHWFTTDGTDVIYTGLLPGGPFPVGNGDTPRFIAQLIGYSLVRT